MAIPWIERKVFERSLTSPIFFRTFARPLLYKNARGDPEHVHETTLNTLNKYEDVVKNLSPRFNFPSLEVDLKGHRVIPFGTAAGLDKNGDALFPLSYMFGFQETGTVVVTPSFGNPRPRIAVDNHQKNLYNAQGYPSKGLDYFLEKVQAFRKKDSRSFILVNICGMPSESGQLDNAYKELEILVNQICPYTDGFVWNPFSPNIASLSSLRIPEVFKESAALIKEKAGRCLKLIKMGPYRYDAEKKEWLDLIDAWLQGGGDGIVAVNTLSVGNVQIPSREWGYSSAGKSGTCLQEYRQRAIRDARKEFPGAVIIGTGGIDSGGEAWAAFHAGANALEGYTPYTFHGFGLIPAMASGVKKKLAWMGYKSLEEFQKVFGYAI